VRHSLSLSIADGSYFSLLPLFPKEQQYFVLLPGPSRTLVLWRPPTTDSQISSVHVILEHRSTLSYLHLVSPTSSPPSHSYGGNHPIGSLSPSVPRWPYGLPHPLNVPGTRSCFPFKGPFPLTSTGFPLVSPIAHKSVVRPRHAPCPAYVTSCVSLITTSFLSLPGDHFHCSPPGRLLSRGLLA